MKTRNSIEAKFIKILETMIMQSIFYYKQEIIFWKNAYIFLQERF